MTSKPHHVYALMISTGQTSLEDTSIIGLYKTWADAIKKAKHVLAWGESGKACSTWTARLRTTVRSPSRGHRRREW